MEGWRLTGRRSEGGLLVVLTAARRLTQYGDARAKAPGYRDGLHEKMGHGSLRVHQDEVIRTEPSGQG